jgi:hypothetical protein
MAAKAPSRQNRRGLSGPVADNNPDVKLLARIGFVRGEEESLAETFARFLGITPRQLRVQLQRRAAGQPAE